ncbi:nucleotide sugar dehydrogenase [Paenibacillus aquistagni]|uniref:nucleotide sugar dehydrogenase n=1 Tax=Paenibacillus aquistagni TaxID=1852522 RepID=UPI000B50E590|nr:nucleotide sugar dehydrogenase [Paenibacillus aquistagni]NMM54268.1 nucleotide sugar dehydrogenase [Paenibacillus aquistagni]
MKLCVIGLGYIGLPTAIMFAKYNVDVYGVDINSDIIERLSSGHIHIEEPGLQEMLEDALHAKKLSFGVLPVEADAFIISVPTPINSDKSANLDYVIQATESILPYIKKGNLVILESTVPPRTIEDVVLPILSRSKLNVLRDLYVAHSPERVLPGKLLEELVNNDRIVGGINQESSEKTAELYRSFVKGNIHITDATTAEMVKLMENTYRDVNIAYANELAKIAEHVGFNVWEAIDLANCHPRVNIHKPGPGVGGHCIAVDPWFIYESAPSLANLVHTSRTINDGMPKFVVNKMKHLLPSNNKNLKTVAVLGLAFKGNIDDMRESPAVEIVEQLRDDYNLQIYDPHVKEYITGRKDTLAEAVHGADVILILTDHNEFKQIDPKEIASIARGSLVFDTRNVVDQQKWSEAGFVHYVLGQQSPNLCKMGSGYIEATR